LTSSNIGYTIDSWLKINCYLKKETIMSILNLTQHPATIDQIKAGVVDLPTKKFNILRDLLTFDAIPTTGQMQYRAKQIIKLVPKNNHHVMLGGAPYMMPVLDQMVRESGLIPLYAFSKRESTEKIDSEGKFIKTNVFKHLGFVGI
jgi:hypothetical protein